MIINMVRLMIAVMLGMGKHLNPRYTISGDRITWSCS